MKNHMNRIFKPTPDRFRYCVASAIREAEISETSEVRNKSYKPFRVIIAAALILALIPASVIGAVKLYGLYAQPVDKYGVALNLESNSAIKDYPEYVKMNVTVPDGFAVEPNTDGLKYSAVNGSGAFSLCPMRSTDSSMREVVGDVGSYEELTLCGHTAFNITQVNHTGSFDRLYVLYEDMNVLLLIYYDNVTEEELRAFAEGVSFTEGTAADHTELWEPFDARIENKAAYTISYTYTELERDTVMTFFGFSQQNGDESLRYTARIADIRVTDDLSGIDNARVKRSYNADTVTGRNSLYDTEQLTDENGRLLPRTVTVTQYGDGFNTLDEVLSTQDMAQSLVLIDLCYTNLSDEDVTLYIPYELQVLNKDNSGFTLATDIDPDQKIYASNYCDPEMLYNSDPLDLEKSYYCTSLGATETKIVTIGFRCCTEMLDRAYLTIVDATSAGILDPAPPVSDGSTYPNYIIKVR